MGIERMGLLLGGNVGDRLLYMKKAVDLLALQWGPPQQLSSLYQTAAWGFEAEDFYNLVVVFKSNTKPITCLEITQNIEKKLGRSEKSKEGQYQSRVMDIDILFYGQEIIDKEVLQIPHPRIAERRFVLEPLMEIMPSFKHPKSQRSIKSLWEQCPDTSRIMRLNEHL